VGLRERSVDFTWFGLLFGTLVLRRGGMVSRAAVRSAEFTFGDSAQGGEGRQEKWVGRVWKANGEVRSVSDNGREGWRGGELKITYRMKEFGWDDDR
jgi:hypothetical protein